MQGSIVAADTRWARRRARLPGCAALVDSVLPSQVALTFDDGPDREGTPAILDALASAGATATFFVLLDRVAVAPDLVARTVAAGHEVALHGITHDRVDRVAPNGLAGRLREARRQLEDFVGRPVTQFRPPFGRASWRTFLAAGRVGLSLALWSHDPRDWEEGGDERIATCLEPGAIVLLHDGDLDGSRLAARTATAVAAALPPVMARGLTPVTLSGA